MSRFPKFSAITKILTASAFLILAFAPYARGEASIFTKKKKPLEPLPQPTDMNSMVRAQIYLDTQNFGNRLAVGPAT